MRWISAAPVLLVVVLAGWVSIAPAASAATASARANVVVVAGEPTATTAPSVGDAGIGGLDPGADTPSATGRSEPSRTQRTVDTLIFVGLLVVFGAGVVVALWSARRPPSPSGGRTRRWSTARLRR